jgi:hypothetical protein
MKKLYIGLAALLFLGGAASAGQPTSLSDAQMDRVIAAGFSAFAVADAQASGKVVTTFAATVAQVGPVTTSTGIHVTISFGEALAGVSPLIIQGMNR